MRSGDSPRQAEAARRWLFADAVLDERSLTLTVRGTATALDPKPLEVLLHLLNHAGEVVTKDELLAAVWPGRILSDAGLTSCVARLRAALADDSQTIIKTVHGYGYRLVAPVKVEASTRTPPPRFDFKSGQSPPGHSNWRLVDRLGTGGHGEVWLARHDKTGEPRIFKYALDQEALPSLKREITLSRYLHDTLGDDAPFVRVLDWNLDAAPFCIQAEYTHGGNLVNWAQQQGGIAQVPLATRLDLAVKIVDALALAHSAGVLHKDLKPSNVLIDLEGGGTPRIRLSDFGSGGVLEPGKLDAMGITRMGLTMTQGTSATSGTPIYLAPELIAEQPATMQTDIYAMGVLLYQLVIGDLRRPLAPGWEHDVEDELLREDIAAAAAGNPARRLKDCAELAARLKNLEQRRLDRSRAVLPQAQTPAMPPPARWRRWGVAGIVAAIAVAGLLYGTLRRPGEPGAAPGFALAVLPFSSASAEPDSQAFADGLFLEFQRALARVPGLRVTPREAVMKYRGVEQDPRAAGAALRVPAMLMAEVDWRGNELTLKARVARVDGSEAWSQTFRGSADALFTIQDQVVERAVRESGVAVAAGARSGFTGRGTNNAAAYALYLLASGRPVGRPTSIAQADFEGDLALLEKAIALDPRFARAHASLATVYHQQVYWNQPQDREALKKGFAAVERALELDLALADAHTAKALLGMTPLNGFDFDLGIRESRRALAIDGTASGALANLGIAYSHIGLLDQLAEVSRHPAYGDLKDATVRANEGIFLIWSGESQRGLDILEKIPPKEMAYPWGWYWAGAWALMDLGRMMQAEARVAEYFKNHEDRSGMLTGTRALLHARMGEYALADKDIAVVAKLPPFGHFHHTAYNIGAAYAAMNRRPEALRWLKQAADTGFPNYPRFSTDRALDKIRDDPGFTELLNSLRERRERYLALATGPVE